MAANISPIFPLTPYAVVTSLAAQTACTTRAPTAIASLAAANIVALVPAGSTNGRKIDTIRVKAASSSFTAATAGNLVGIWYSDGVNATLEYEILVQVVTPSTTSQAFESEITIPNLVLPATHALYVSVSVTTTAATTALTVKASGGDY